MEFDEVNKKPVSEVTGQKTLECAWTSVPMVLLSGLFGPSVSYCESTENYPTSNLEINIIAHQWYWSFETTIFDKKVRYDSRMISSYDVVLNGVGLRLLEVDNRLVLPVNREIKLNVTSRDVIHSFAVPALGLKVDAVPGRINQANITIRHEGVYYGQCSEICGINHGHMPL